ncbi:MAG: hypothetical protein L0H63_11860 [Nitrococcus sp.]|nr:hypothetical protein [Nitrococcus sp.]
MTVQSSALAALSIGTTTVADVQAEYDADTYTAVGEIEDFGQFGDVINPVNFISLADSRVRKLKGSRDAGTMNLTVGFDPGDAGQDALIAAFADTGTANYNFKVELDDAVSTNGTTFYFSGHVMSYPVTVGSADNVIKRAFAIAINTAIIEKAAA